MSQLRSRVTFANVASALALIVALSGSAYAVSSVPKNSVTSKSIQNGAVAGRDVADNSLQGVDIDETSLSCALIPSCDSPFDSGQYYTRTESDQRFLGANGKAADADRLNGMSSDEFLGANGKATDADRLDGLNSNAFLGAAAKAADSEQIDGLDSERLLRLRSGLPGGLGVVSAFTHTATAANKLSANGTDVDNPATNGNPNAILLITQKLNPNGIVYNNSPVGVYYNTIRNKWEIFNENNVAIPNNAQFNVMVLNGNP